MTELEYLNCRANILRGMIGTLNFKVADKYYSSSMTKISCERIFLLEIELNEVLDREKVVKMNLGITND